MSTATFQAIVAAPGFCLGVRCNAHEISAIEFLESHAGIAPENPLAAEACTQLHAYLNDPTHRFSLPLKMAGTAFQQRVWAQIAAIPLGEIRFYGQLAKNLENAPRAVGQACGANPYPLIVPCHRVIATGGSGDKKLGGFNRQRGGFLLEVKRWLLKHEGHDFAGQTS